MSLIYRRIYQINAFIYCTDNIPDHRSRRFGCCPCQMAVRKFGCSQNKKPYPGGNLDTENAK